MESNRNISITFNPSLFIFYIEGITKFPCSSQEEQRSRCIDLVTYFCLISVFLSSNKLKTNILL